MTLDDLERPKRQSKVLLSQRKPRDAVVNFDTYRNLQQHRSRCPPCDSTASCTIIHFAV